MLERIPRHWRKKKQPMGQGTAQPENNQGLEQDLTNDIDFNIATISKIMGYASDVIIRKFTLSSATEIKAAIIAIKGLYERELINEQILAAVICGLAD